MKIVERGYMFYIATITNYQKIRGSNNTNLTQDSVVQKYNMSYQAKIKVSARLGSVSGELLLIWVGRIQFHVVIELPFIFPCQLSSEGFSIQSLPTYLHLLVSGPLSPPSKAASVSHILLCYIFLIRIGSTHLQEMFFTFKDSCDQIGLTWIISPSQALILITSATFTFRVTYAQVLVIQVRTSLGGHYSAYNRGQRANERNSMVNQKGH